MKKLLLISLSFFFITTLNAEYLRTIRIGSFIHEKDAQESLLKLEEFIVKHKNIILLEDKYAFKFSVRKSGKYYITCAEPFTSRKVLQEVLDTLRLEYDGIYVTKLKKKKKHLESIPDMAVTEKKVTKKVKQPLQIQNPIKKDLVKKELPLEKKAPPSQLVEAEKDNKMWMYLFFITFSLLLFFIRLRVVSKKEIENLSTKELMIQEKLSQAILEVKKKEQFLSYASHELRTPMTAIIGLTHLVLEDDLSKAQQDYIQKIEGSAQHLVSIVNDILDISKLEESEIKIEKVEFNINDILEYVINIVAIQAKNNNVMLSLDIEKDVPALIVGDSLRLGQILINLLSNSVKFTKDGEVKLSVRKISSFEENITLDFAVSDTGIGMTQEQVKNIFESYSQAEESTSRKFGGTGLGLSISKQLVELMNGKIKVDSKKGEGSIFSFYVDFYLKDSQNKRQYRLPSSKLLNKRVLIVNKTKSDTLLLSRYLTYFHYKVNTIPSFEEVVFEKEISYDIILINQANLTSNALVLIKEMQLKNNIKVVILKELYCVMESTIQNNLNIDTSLSIPFTQQSVLNMIIELYVSKTLDVRSKKLSMKNRFKDVAEKKILVVEDNELNHKVIAGLLANTRVHLTFVTNGQEAVDTILEHLDYDLVLMDINMPMMDGYEATKEIRKHKECDVLPILALTADVMEESIEKALSSGMQGYITKPIIVDVFYKKIFDILTQKKMKFTTSEVCKPSTSDALEELSVSLGLSRCNDDTDFYKTILKDFKIMYKNSSIRLEELCKEGNFKEARTNAMDIKDVSLNIGAYNLCEYAATMEYEFEKGDRSQWVPLLELYTSSLEKLFKDIDKYLKA